MDENVYVLLLNGAQGSTIPSHMNVESRFATSDHNTSEVALSFPNSDLILYILISPGASFLADSYRTLYFGVYSESTLPSQGVQPW
jgi:hypothetical protein